MFTALQREALDAENKDLVISAKAFLDEHPAYRGQRALGTNAMRNLLDVAQVSGCLEEIVAFVQYQIGRDYRAWITDDNNRFGFALEKALGPESPVAHAADRASRHPALAGVPSDEVAVTMARRWLGFLYRYFRYREKLATVQRGDAPRNQG